MPKEIVDRRRGVTMKALAAPEVKEKLAGIGTAPMPMNPTELQRFIIAEIANWIRLAKEAGIEPE